MKENSSCSKSKCLVAAVLSILTFAAVAAFFLFGGFDSESPERVQKEAAEALIKKFMGDDNGLKVRVSIDPSMQQDSKDAFSYNLAGKTLDIKSSSGVAACRGFYDFVKSNNAGICSWSGNRYESPETFSVTSKEVVSPYRDHQYLNVVTYGYSAPYWDEARWDEEILWMAMHGIDMPLMLIGQEAIYRRIFMEDYGLSDEELDEWEVGPAHLPWFRMGNLSGKQFEGPLGKHWHERQLCLARHILKTMRELGMKPICPAFGGFVPKALSQKGIEGVESVGWEWCRDGISDNYRLAPSSEEFIAIGKRFIQEWEKEFGVCKYYLSDSFNEMAIPDDLDLLTQYGDNVFRCIAEGSSDPGSVWVTQGWTFVYQNGEWGKAKFDALTKNIPKHRFNMHYMSPEYGNAKWDDPYEGFNGHDWTVTMLPNMGGKTLYNGSLEEYAGIYRNQYAGNSNCANMTGWGLTAEGIENNEIIYELICDAGWLQPDSELDLQEWKSQYVKSRYGQAAQDSASLPKEIVDLLHRTELSKYIDHKCFGWQGNNRSKGYYIPDVLPGEEFLSEMKDILSEENLCQYTGGCPSLLRADLIEAAVYYAGCKVEALNSIIMDHYKSGNLPKARELVDSVAIIMTKMDRLLTAHPLYNEQRWENMAAALAGPSPDGTVQPGGEDVRAKYVKNARCLVTVWHGARGTAPDSHEPVNDYANRVWAGLIRDYYLPRLVAEWSNVLDGTNHNLRDIENSFVAAPSLSEVALGSLGKDTSDSEIVSLILELVEDASIAGN